MSAAISTHSAWNSGRIDQIRNTPTTRNILPSTALFMLFRSWNAVRSDERLVKFQFGAAAREGQAASWVAIPEPR